MTMKLRCMLFGHKPAPTHESGFEVCERCGLHEYYHYPEYQRADILRERFYRIINFFRFKRWREKGWRYHVCHDCGKLDRIFGVPTGNHKNCLPF